MFNLAAGIIKSLFGIVDKTVKDKDLAEKLKYELNLAAMSGEITKMEKQAAVIVAEAQGKSWIQNNWRPITMLTFVFILANNYILVPYAVAFGLEVPILEIPSGMWGLLTVGIGGYIGGRTLEKVQKERDH